ncbi:exonuclease [Ktedonobacter sp. SOSP1-85]|uniref:3'-5' exonuclease n=1 Tax=Ktedonobacter sp. SOSP1-85 TaxID=2778367 RepID=UPI001915AFA1|nr:3'-5' exonuclease [Ktedonobacter sp. SOSP1-85]GHO75990.1 exonuclease [Ktedonobacter sp. SOSP1-85]
MPKKLLDQLLVIDIEATCWQGVPPNGQENEIIEIGLVPLDLVTGQRLEKRSILVRPERSRVSEFCTELTTLTQEQVDGGITFAEACGLLREEYRSRERVWASYGDYDRSIFERQCRERKVAYPFGTRHLNIKTLFALSYALPSEIGLEAALHTMRLPLEGTHHRGDDDAWNSAAILAELLRRSREGRGEPLD